MLLRFRGYPYAKIRFFVTQNFNIYFKEGKNISKIMTVLSIKLILGKFALLKIDSLLSLNFHKHLKYFFNLNGQFGEFIAWNYYVSIRYFLTILQLNLHKNSLQNFSISVQFKYSLKCGFLGS